MTISTLNARLVTKAQYLSGNVRQKLRDAKAAAVFDPAYARNIEALEKVMPQPIPIEDISIRLGATWFPPGLVQRFIEDVLEVNVACNYRSDLDVWDIEVLGTEATHPNSVTYGIQWEEPRRGPGGLEIWEVAALTGVDLVRFCLDMKFPTVKKKISVGIPRVMDPTLTATARNKQALLQQRFADWCREDPNRAEDLQRLYNDRFNSIVLPQYDGSHLSLVGMSKSWEEKVRSRPYQLNGIWRGLTTPTNFALWWEMGLGKMLAAIAIAILSKHMGKCQKPMVVVQRSTLQQYRKACREAFPAARVLVAREQDLEKGKRQIFLSRIASGCYDCVVVTHQQFERLQLNPEEVKAALQAELEPLTAELDEVEPERDARKQIRSVKAAIRKERRLKKKIADIRDALPGELFFTDTGVDMILYDEAHAVKNEPIDTKMYQVNGVPRSSSRRAIDFGLKRDYLNKVYGEGRIIKLTGTPINNSTAECYKELKDLCPSLLRELGINSFDEWVGVFCRVSTGVEIKMTGTLGMTTRLNDYENVPELKHLLRLVADIRTAEEEGIQKPDMKEIIVTARMSPAQREYMDYLLERAELIHLKEPMQWDVYDDDGNPVIDPETGEQVKKTDCNLFVTTHGRLSSLAMRLIDEHAPEFLKSKLHKAARRIANIYHRTRAGKATQVVFCDLGTPSGNSYNVYQELKDLIVSRGVPAHMVAFDHDYDTDDARETLDESINRGDMPILLTSSEKGGVGRNFHALMIAAHLLDPTWGFIYDAQRIMRVHRPGNKNPVIRIYRYITEGIAGNLGFDSFMYQHCQRKKLQNYSALSPDMTTRSYGEDLSTTPAFTYAQLKAIASGDPNVIRLVEVDAELEKQRQIYKGMDLDYNRMVNGWVLSSPGIPYYERQVKDCERSLAVQRRDFDMVRENLAVTTDEGFVAYLLNQEFTDPLEFAKRLREIRDAVIEQDRLRQVLEVGAYGGFALTMLGIDENEFQLKLQGPSGRSYRVYNFVKTPKIFADDRRLQRSLEDILAIEEDLQHQLAVAHEKLEDLRESLKDIETQREAQAQLVRQLELEKATLERTLGVSADAEQEVVVGADENDAE